MDYKEKYEQALKMAQETYNTQPMYREWLEKMFPELKESEDENKLKYSLMQYLWDMYHKDFCPPKPSIELCNKWITWLDKQSDNFHVNFAEAEQEKYDFVSGQYIECRASFNEFKEDNSYWLEYVGNDNYIGRSDNILNQKFHITPRQLFTLFTQQHCPKEDSNVNDETNAPTGYGKYVDECLNEASKHFFSEGEDKYSVADLFYAGVRCGKSWLEKQNGKEFPASEKRDFGYFSDPADKIEPKFKIGDFIANDYCFGKVIALTDDAYLLDTEQGIPFSCKHNVHLWTIQDAKLGDVLVHNGCTFIFMGIKDGIVQALEETLLNDINPVAFGRPAENNDYQPATKEQRALLFSKMKEAGWKWDAEKKELRLLITNGGDFFESENCNQKSAEWKQENIEELTEFENAMMHIGGSFFGENAGLDPNDTDTIKEQAELLLKLAPKTEWSEEDEKEVAVLEAYIRSQDWNERRIERALGIIDTFVNKSKFLKHQQKQEWNEEDEDMIQALNTCIDAAIKSGMNYISFDSKSILIEKVKNWLKFIKQKLGG